MSEKERDWLNIKESWYTGNRLYNLNSASRILRDYAHDKNKVLQAENERLKAKLGEVRKKAEESAQKFPLKSGITFGEGYGCFAAELLDILKPNRKAND